LAHAKGQFVGGKTEEKDADELRMAVSDALCRGPERLKTFKEVLPSIEAIEGGLRRYLCSNFPLGTSLMMTDPSFPSFSFLEIGCVTTALYGRITG